MRVTLFFCLCVFGLSKSIAQTCLAGVTFITTQAQIDSIPINNPGCTQILGGVQIIGTDITNLDGFANIASVEGSLQIKDCPALIDMSGLGNLTSVGGFLGVENCNALLSLTGLQSLVSVGWHMQIKFNDGLTSINGFTNLKTVDGDFEIYNNPNLVTLLGFDALEDVDGYFIINDTSCPTLPSFSNLFHIGINLSLQHNTALTAISGFNALTDLDADLILYNNPLVANINGFSNLQAMGGRMFVASMQNLNDISGFGNLDTLGWYLFLSDLPMLSDLESLSSLTSIDGFLRIQQCAGLTSLNGLENIDTSGISDLIIVQNPNLSICEYSNICNYLSVASNPANISGNAPGCATRTEIETACLLPLPVELLSFAGEISNNNTYLTWVTPAEINSAGFYIERSFDAVQWNEIGYVPARNDIGHLSHYEFIDTDERMDGVYYRLRQIEDDGISWYSDIVFVQHKRVQEFTIYPNPVEDELYLNLGSASRDARITIYNSQGQIIRSFVRSGQQHVVNTENLTSCMYTIVVDIRSKRFAKRFIKR